MDEVILNKAKNVKEFLKSFRLDNIDYSSFLLNLLDISISRGNDIIFIALVKDERIVCAGLFSKSKRQLLGINYNILYLYGYSFFDYNQVYILPKFKNEFFILLRKYSKLQALDLVLLENIKFPVLLINSILQKKTIQIFDSTLSSKGFTFIAGKKSLKRHRNIVKRDFEYKVKHLKGSMILDENYQDLIYFHKERWAFDNVCSSFEDMTRINFYKNLKENSLMTVITLNNELLALHFGILNDKRLIWHTPVLNVKFLEFSPIEVLLFETSNFCESNNLRFLDFGLGDETYKYRFSNSEECIYDYIIPLNFRTRSLVLISKLLKNIYNLFNIAHLLKKGFSFFNRIKVVKNKINLYKLIEGDSIFELSNNDVKFKKFTDYSEFVNFKRLTSSPVKRFQFLRFKEGDGYYCLHKGSNIICDGWSRSKSIFISEIDKEYIFEKGSMLYDFNTITSFRNKGYYKFLLKKIISILNEDLYIYSLSDNIASNKAIKAVGFKLIRHNLK